MTEQQQETFNLHGKYQAQSGKRYQYYGYCKTWVPGGQSPWRIYLYDEQEVHPRRCPDKSGHAH